MRARPIVILLVLLAALVVAGCGGDDGSSGDDAARDTSMSTTTPAEDTTGTDAGGGSAPAAAGGTTLDVGVQGDKLKFDKQALEAPAGTVTIRLTNTSDLQHDIGIADADGNDIDEGDLAGKGETSTVTADLQPGTYMFFCGPHRSAGMTGVLTVT